MSRVDFSQEAAQVLFREAELLDARRWDEWLALYTDDCVYWAPAWVDEDAVTHDPRSQVSLIHYQSRSGLEERVRRIRSGQSIASTPLPRTLHLISNVTAEASGPDQLDVRSALVVEMWDLRRQTAVRLFGRCEHRLYQAGSDWRISRKVIVILNDVLPAVVDIYTL